MQMKGESPLNIKFPINNTKLWNEFERIQIGVTVTFSFGEGNEKRKGSNQ